MTVLTILTIALTSLAQAGDYLSDFEAAQKKAKEEKKPLLVKFTGSDWCPPCKKLDEAIFSQKKFKEEVEKDFVVAVLDFPRTKKLPEGQLEANKKVAKEFEIRGYPTVLLINQDGKVIKTMVGYGGPPPLEDGEEPGKDYEVNAYLDQLKEALKAQKFL